MGKFKDLTEAASFQNGDMLIMRRPGNPDKSRVMQINKDKLPGSASGEVNTVSNIGVAGVGIFKQKTGVDFELKKINAGSSKVTITDDTTNNEVDIDLAEANIDHDSLLNTHNLTTDIDHDSLLNYVLGQHRIINDSGTSLTELWSANKINTVTTTTAYRSIVTKTNADSPYYATASDFTILADASAGAITVILDAAASNNGRILNIKKIDSSANAITIDGYGMETIDGAGIKTIVSQYDSLTIHCDGYNWYII